MGNYPAAAVLLLSVLPHAALMAGPQPETRAAFDRYIQLTEARMERDTKTGPFLRSASGTRERADLRDGKMAVERARTRKDGEEIKAPDGMIQDWIGTAFFPGVTIARVRSTLQDYAHYPEFYKPDVIGAQVLAHHGNEFKVALRLFKKQFLTVILNGDYRVLYVEPAPGRMTVASRSLRLEPEGSDLGLLWALNSYWRFEEADGGVYAQLEAISLSRDIPFALAWLKSWLQKFPRESMENTLTGTLRAVESRINSL